MSNYIRVLPRDLFNEASLLKCMGALWIALDNARDHGAVFEVEDVDSFDIRQNEESGAIYVANVSITINGMSYSLERPLNSREPWPLWLEGVDDPDFEPIEVFTDDGELSPEFVALIEGDAA